MKKRIVAVAALTLAALLTTPAGAQTDTSAMKSQPGKVSAMRTVKATAKITAIDAATRTVKLMGPKGKELEIVAGPEVKNFAQLKVGDNVDIQYLESLVVELKKGGGMAVGATTESAMASAKPGSSPAGVVGQQTTLVGDVIALDPATQTVTVRGKERTVDLKVRDPEQFKLVAKGDQIQATYTEAIAVMVVPKKKK